MSENSTFKAYLLAITIGLFAVIVFGLLWLLLGSNANPDGLGWFLFSFIAGLSMIVLPCTLPLAFVIVPLSMGKGLRKGVGIALSFGLGVSLMLSIYGIAAALVGQAAIGSLGAPLEVVKNWVYFIAGIFALLFALGEIGLLKVKMPTYSGSAPAFIQKQGDFLKAFMLGMFLGNVGVGCPHPATPLILIEIASSGDVLYGWFLFLTHAVGRVLPLILLAFLGIMGVNGLQWIVARKDKVEKATGFAMVFVAGFILTLGLFSHDWWVNSGIHTQLEKVTQEAFLLDIVRGNLNSTVTHSHGIEDGTGLFGLPLWLGSPFMVTLWIIPLWWYWLKRRREIEAIPETNQVNEREAERKNHLSKEKALVYLCLLLIFAFVYYLPHNFLMHEALEGGHAHPGMSAADLQAHTAAEQAAGGAAGHAHPGMSAADLQAHLGAEGAIPPGAMAHTMPDGTVMYMMPDGTMITPGGGAMAGHSHASTYLEAAEISSGIAVSLSATQEEEGPLESQVETTLTFTVFDKATGAPIDDLEISQEKYMHIIGIRSDLNEFFHVHPVKTAPGVWVVTRTFAKAGTYKIYTDVARAGAHYTIGHPEIAIAGFMEPENTQITFGTNVILGNHQVGIDRPDPIVAGIPASLHFVVKDVYGMTVPLETYLGVQMHLNAFKLGSPKTYLHAHPDAVSAMRPSDAEADTFSLVRVAHAHGVDVHTDPALIGGTVVPFTLTFPEPGIYKVFGQFRPQGLFAAGTDEAVVASFYVAVMPEGTTPGMAPTQTQPVTPVSKPVAVIVSLILMGGFTYGVWRYLNPVKPK